MNDTLIRTFLEASLVNAQARVPASDNQREGRPTHNGDRLAQDIKTLLKLMELGENNG
jgi:hypothetical protein